MIVQSKIGWTLQAILFKRKKDQKGAWGEDKNFAPKWERDRKNKGQSSLFTDSHSALWGKISMQKNPQQSDQLIELSPRKNVDPRIVGTSGHFPPSGDPALIFTFP